MFTYNNKVYGDAGYYVSDSKRAGFCLALDESVEYTEHPLTGEVEKISDSLFKLSGKFYFNVYDPENIKRDLIKLLYDNDEQIAIMLNQPDSDYGQEMYDKMQAWRDYLGQISKQIMQELNPANAE